MGDFYTGDAADPAEQSFTSARRKALLKSFLARLRRDPESIRLRPFEVAKNELGPAHQVYLDRMEVPIREIVGSVARYRDFDRDFLPRKPGLKDCWKEIHRTARGGGELPPVSLYKIGDDYFVEDGNHRVSVVRHGSRRGRGATIKAEVVALVPRQPPPDGAPDGGS